MVRARHDVRLLPAAASTWVAAWWAAAAPADDSRAASVVVLGLGALLAVLLVVRPGPGGRRPAASARGRSRARTRARRGSATATAGVLVGVLLACGCSGAVLGLASWQQDRRHPPVLERLLDGPARAVAEVVVTGDPVTGRGELAWQREQVRVRVALVALQGPDVRHEVRVPALLSGDDRWTRVRWGQRLRLPVALAPAPAGAPYRVFARAAGEPELVGDAAWWWRGADRLRDGLLTAATAGGRTDAAALLPGLVVGDTTLQPPDLVEDMRTSGLAHLSAVSGANVTIVCGGVLLLGVLLRLGRRARVVLAGLALLGLVVVARPEPSVLRAAVMGSVGLLGLLLGRRGGGLSALAVAVLGVLLLDPWLARAPGFRLSVVATAALVVLAAPWARALGRLVPRGVAVVLAVPAAAQAGVTPVLVGLDDRVSLYALPANVLAAPAVAPATVIGLVTALVSLVHPAAAALVAVPARVCTAWIAWVARTSADLPAAALPWPQGRTGLVVAVLAPLLLVALAALALRLLPDRRPPGLAWAPWPALPAVPGRARPATRTDAPAGGGGAPRRHGTGREVRGVVAALVVAVLGVVWWWPRWSDDAWPGAGWAVVVCDVGQGESVLLRAGPDSAVVVDTGPEPAPVVGCLRRAGVRTVPLLVLSHLHADHVGGLQGLAAQVPVQRVWTAPAGMPEGPEADLTRWADENAVPLDRPTAGATATVGQARLEVLAPRGPSRPPGGPAAGAGAPVGGEAGGGSEGGGSQDVNDAGLVVRVATGGLTVLAVGDIGSEVQQRLLSSGATVRADVTTVAHHGSADQWPAFWRAVGADVAVASAGRDNSYGHPSPRAMAVLGEAGSLALSTAAHGDVALRAVPATPERQTAGDDRPRDDGTQDGAAAPDVGVRTTRASPRRAGRFTGGRRRVPA